MTRNVKPLDFVCFVYFVVTLSRFIYGLIIPAKHHRLDSLFDDVLLDVC